VSISSILSSSEAKVPPTSFEGVAKIVGTFVGLAYASGFLVVSTYLQRLGVRSTVPDLFRLRYIHVGVLCLLLPAFVVPALFTFCTSLCSGLKKFGDEAITGLIEICAGAMGLLMALVLYGLLEFSKFEAYRKHAATVLVFWLAVLVLVWIRFKYPKPGLGPFGWALTRLLVTLAGLVAGCNLITVAFAGRVGFIVSIPVLTYFAIVGVCSSYVLLMLKEGPPSPDGKSIHIIRVVLLIGLYYLSVLAFAYQIFPKIPAERGGGDFADLESVRLCTDYDSLLPHGLAYDATHETPQRLSLDPHGKYTYGVTTCSMWVTLIEETSDAVVVMHRGLTPKVYVVKAKVNLALARLTNTPSPEEGAKYRVPYAYVWCLVVVECFAILVALWKKRHSITTSGSRRVVEPDARQSLWADGRDGEKEGPL
jgi:hypothetical protein